jgi:hypothetical protein
MVVDKSCDGRTDTYKNKEREDSVVNYFTYVPWHCCFSCRGDPWNFVEHTQPGRILRTARGDISFQFEQ